MATSEADLDSELRAAMFAWLDTRTAFREELTWDELLRGFRFKGRPFALSTQQGIRKVAGLDAALAFTTTYTPPGAAPPYADVEGPDGLPRYKYRGQNPDLSYNRALRTAQQRGLPLAWFIGVAPGVYLAKHPVFLVADEPEQLQFAVALDEEQYVAANSTSSEDVRRRNLLRLTRLRLHQPVFRARVLRAYETRCAVCRLRHATLLDAAHIKSDAEGGLPVIPNGLALCKLHHAAYDAGILGIRPDYTVHMRQDVLLEVDGPMLRHGLQEVDGYALQLPRRRDEHPDRRQLAERYHNFLTRSGTSMWRSVVTTP